MGMDHWLAGVREFHWDDVESYEGHPINSVTVRLHVFRKSSEIDLNHAIIDYAEQRGLRIDIPDGDWGATLTLYDCNILASDLAHLDREGALKKAAEWCRKPGLRFALYCIDY